MTRPAMEAVERAARIMMLASSELMRGPQRSEDLREALRVVHAAGADLEMIRRFWRVAGYRAPPPNAGKSWATVYSNEMHSIWCTVERQTGLQRWRIERQIARETDKK